MVASYGRGAFLAVRTAVNGTAKGFLVTAVYGRGVQDAGAWSTVWDA